jgi:hypothetical protein
MPVTWHLIARPQPRQSEPLGWVLPGHLVLIAPWGLCQFVMVAEWRPRLLALLLASACANVLYFQSLHSAYQQAPVAFVYPRVRSSPLLIAVWRLLFLGELLNKQCGRQAALDRLCELLLIRLSRHCLDRGLTQGGTLAGLADPRLVKALLASARRRHTRLGAVGHGPACRAVARTLRGALR